MGPRLKEDPKEWRNFALLCCAMLQILAGIGYWRQIVTTQWFGIVVGSALVLALLALVRPRFFRGFYRVAMTVSFHIGQVMGKVILGVFYIVILTPLGLLLRLMGKELLEMRLDREKSSYWKKAPKRGRLDQQF